MFWMGAISVMAAPGILPPAALVDPCSRRPYAGCHRTNRCRAVSHTPESDPPRYRPSAGGRARSRGAPGRPDRGRCARRASRCPGSAPGCADPRADGGVLVLRRHPGTSTQAEQHGCGNCTECVSLHGIDVSMFRGGDARDCARAIVECRDGPRYRKRSARASQTWERMQTELNCACPSSPPSRARRRSRPRVRFRVRSAPKSRCNNADRCGRRSAR
jgi:hypothetical protein